jgi:hypothetical protein
MAWCDSLNSLIQVQIVHGVGLGLCKAAFGGEVGEGGVAGGGVGGPGRTPRVPGWTTYVMQVSIHTQSPAVTIHSLGKSTYAWFLYPLFCEVYICIYMYIRIYMSIHA